MTWITKDAMELTLLQDLQKQDKTNISKMRKQVYFLMDCLNDMFIDEMNVMITKDGHVNVGSFIECYLKARYNDEKTPSYSSKGLKDLTLKYYDSQGNRHTKSFEVKTILRNESSEVISNRLDLLIISYNGINYLSRSKYNEIKNDPDYFKKGTHRLNKNILRECECNAINNLHDLLMLGYFSKK